MDELRHAHARRDLRRYHLLLAAVAAVTLGWYLFVRITGWSVPCFFLLFTRLYCPGCGCTRALGALLRGDIIDALLSNPFVPATVFIAVYYEWRFLAACRDPHKKVPSWPFIVYAFSLLIFAALRDLLLVFFGIDHLGDLLQYWS